MKKYFETHKAKKNLSKRQKGSMWLTMSSEQSWEKNGTGLNAKKGSDK